MKNKEKSSKKKTKIILIIIGSLLILIGLFLFWFFNRKFDVTFKVNDIDEYVVKVKYNHKIKEKDIKTDKELGENFIDWYEVVSTENDKEVLAKNSYDFSTKIKEDVLLKATYKGQVETITITFDSKGGSEVDSITINKGAELTLPDNPTRSGYTFVTWELEDGTPIYNNTKLDEDTTLYANWKKNEEPKKEEPKKEEPKTEEPKEETISLSLSRSIIHRNGYKTSKATAKVENASGDVTYSIDKATCVSIDKTTGDLTADNAPTSGTKLKYWLERCANDNHIVTVTATLPSGKSASATLTIEKDLVLYASNTSVKRAEEIKLAGNGKVLPADSNKRFYVDANQVVTWTAKADNTDGTCTAVSVTSKSDSYVGDLKSQCTDGNARNTYITATTTANQQITVQYYQNIN